MACPITQMPFVDPVVAADGHTYERAAIERWLEEHDTSPMTRVKFKSRELVPNRALGAALDADDPLVQLAGRACVSGAADDVARLVEWVADRADGPAGKLRALLGRAGATRQQSTEALAAARARRVAVETAARVDDSCRKSVARAARELESRLGRRLEEMRAEVTTRTTELQRLTRDAGDLERLLKRIGQLARGPVSRKRPRSEPGPLVRRAAVAAFGLEGAPIDAAETLVAATAAAEAGSDVARYYCAVTLRAEPTAGLGPVPEPATDDERVLLLACVRPPDEATLKTVEHLPIGWVLRAEQDLHIMHGPEWFESGARDPATVAAVDLMRLAHEAGVAYATGRVALVLQYGIGTEPDVDGAMELYRKAMVCGCKEAAFNLALLHEDRGEYDEAARLWRLTARDGDGEAMDSLGKQLRVQAEAGSISDLEGLGWMLSALEVGAPSAVAWAARLKAAR